MYPEDRVLVGVINRKRDLQTVINERWYRIPQNRAPHSIDAEYVAFYLSSGMKEKNGGIHYFARRNGYELVRRRDLLPNEPKNPRADDLYYKLEFGEVKEKIPPILNPTARPITFIYTTWDRFINATTIADLYSKADWFVERVIHVLRGVGITPQRIWHDQEFAREIAELRIECQQGIVRAITDVLDGEGLDTLNTIDPMNNAINLEPGDTDAEVDQGVKAIQDAVARLGGVKLINIG